ncbi:MAG: hypothetical protein QG635_2122 [Bacteroidota bacterium]|nr:hypothetical protein [Bacteroidota bacterium]
MQNEYKKYTEMEISIKYRILITLLRIFAKTWRFKVSGDKPEGEGIVAFWHGQMLPAWKYFSKFSPSAIISQSKDGDILSALLTRWKYKLIRGSSSKGGREALDLIIENAKNGLVLITPDGPQGPFKKFKPGAAVAAHRAEVPLYLCCCKSHYKYIFAKSWDKFILPIPFTRIDLKISLPIIIPPEISREGIDKIITDCELWLCGD